MVIVTKKENISIRHNRWILFIYEIIPTFQPAEFGRVYAIHGGIFIISSILWGLVMDKKRPDKYEIIGSFVAILESIIIIFYSPRGT